MIVVAQGGTGVGSEAAVIAGTGDAAERATASPGGSPAGRGHEEAGALRAMRATGWSTSARKTGSGSLVKDRGSPMQPFGNSYAQSITAFARSGNRFSDQEICPVIAVRKLEVSHASDAKEHAL